MSASALLVTCLAGAGAGAWVAYLRWKDKRRPEPLWIVLGATLAGVLSVLPALAGFEMLDGVGRAPTWADLSGPWPGALLAASTIGGVEEVAKLLPVIPIALWSRHFDEIWDGPIYAGAAGVGFSLAETLYLLSGGDVAVRDGVARALVAPITHALFAMPAGLGLAHAVLSGRRWALPAGLAASAVLHGAYDLFLARPGWQLASAGLVFLIWMWLLWVGQELLRRPPVIESTHSPDG